MTDPLSPDAPTPRWVKVAAGVCVAVVVLVLLVLVIGGHDGLNRHTGPETATHRVGRT